MSEIKNKEVDDALHMLLHCSLKDHEYKTQKEQFDIIHDYIKELENKVEVQTICGYSIEEAIQILSALTIEKARDIKVTMSNLKKIVELYQKEQTEMLKKFEKEKLINSLGDTEAYSIRLLYDEWTVGTNYKQNYKVKYNNKLYRCLLDHTSQSDWTPDVAVSLWVEISDPNEEYPEWKQPTGAHDAYKNGDKVSYGGDKYISTVDNNVWTPIEYGWKLVEE